MIVTIRAFIGFSDFKKIIIIWEYLPKIDLNNEQNWIKIIKEIREFLKSKKHFT